MILHPGILALLLGSTLTLLMLIYASVHGTIIISRWDYDSSSAYQLLLERRTYLISTLVNSGLVFQIGSVVIFAYTMDDIHRLFVGAMCATGSLNANPIGWFALLMKMAIFFLAGFWITLNNIDRRAEHYPLIQIKYWFLLALLPLMVLDLFLQLSYFLGLDPDIITSCCGSLFSATGNATTSTLASLPVATSMLLFYGSGIMLLVVLFLTYKTRAGFMRYLLSFNSLLFFIISILSVIAFISIYIYELPTHHCPFDILQKEYDYIGYPLYITLFLGSFFGMTPGLLQPFKKRPGLDHIIQTAEHRWMLYCVGCIVLFVALVSYQIAGSNLAYFS